MRCNFIKADGKQCKAQALKGKEYCFSHSPSTRKEHALAVAKGGSLSSRKDRLALEPIELNEPKDVVTLLETTINDVRTGAMPNSIANTIGYLSSHLLKAIEVADLNTQLEII